MLYITNTRTRSKELFTPISNEKVGFYSCGPTVYNYAHIGNLRTYIFVDVLKRTLSFLGYSVNHVMNITDVGHLTSDADLGEDKLLLASLKENKSAWDIAKYYTDVFLKNLEDLNCILPNTICRATDHIPDQINLIRILESKGHTYRTSDGIYFDTSTFPRYADFARLNLDEQKAGARVEENLEKRFPWDFAVWKFSPSGTTRQMEWESPWGIGFPGWHIECSAMATKYLGQPFDIHSSGIDHIQIHHTNEIAQSEAAYGVRLANYWVHTEHLIIDKKKMAKSDNNFTTLSSIQEKGIDPLAYRFFTFGAHYRQQQNFSWEALRSACVGLESLRSAVRDFYEKSEMLDEKSRMPHESTLQKITELKDSFRCALEDDINLPKAMATVFIFINSIREMASDFTAVDFTYAHAALLDCDRVLGLHLDRIDRSEIPKNIDNLVQLRNRARAEQRWHDADELREKIEDQGYFIEDSNEGTRVSKRTV